MVTIFLVALPANGGTGFDGFPAETSGSTFLARAMLVTQSKTNDRVSHNQSTSLIARRVRLTDFSGQAHACGSAYLQAFLVALPALEQS